MFVCVARVTLEVPASGSVKARRQVLRRVSDRVKAKFNVALAEVEDQDAVLAMAVVGNDRRFVNEQMDKIFHFIDEMYVAPIISREMEILSFNEQLFQTQGDSGGHSVPLEIPRGDRSLAEAEGLGDWETRHVGRPPPPKTDSPASPGKSAASKAAPKKLPLEEARARARRLRNPRDWEKP